MRTTTKWLAALGLIGAAVSVPVLTMPTPASAQEFYFGVPGFGFGVGPGWYGNGYHRYYGEPYGYGYYGRPYWHYRHHYRW